MQLAEREDIATIQLWFEFGEPRHRVSPLSSASPGALTSVGVPGPSASRLPRRTRVAAYQRHFGPGLRFEHEFTGLFMYFADPRRPEHLKGLNDKAYAQAAGGRGTVHARPLTRVRELVELLLPRRCAHYRSRGQVVADGFAHASTPPERGGHVVQLDPQRHLRWAGRTAPLQRPVHGERGRFVLGFTSSSAFSRRVHQQFGLSPLSSSAAPAAAAVEGEHRFKRRVRRVRRRGPARLKKKKKKTTAAAPVRRGLDSSAPGHRRAATQSGARARSTAEPGPGAARNPPSRRRGRPGR